MAVLGHPHVAGDNTLHFALRAGECVHGGEARIDFDAKRFRLLRQPAADIAEARDVIAVIAHQRRENGIRYAQAPSRPEIIKPVGGDGRVERRASRLPVGNEFIERNGIDDRARQNMRAHFGALFQHTDANLAACLHCELFQADRSGETGRPRPHDHHVEIHAFAFGHGGFMGFPK